MQDTDSGLEELLGIEGVKKLARTKIAIFGVGSVGSYVAETLARCGIGSLTLVDHATITESAIARQLGAFQSNIGKSKVQVLKEQILDIDHNILVHTYESFFSANTRLLFDLRSFDYIVDTLGDISGKLLLIETAKAENIPLLSCMGICDRLDPQKIEITDISKTRVCPVAKMIRTELRKKGVRDVKVLFSKERPMNMDLGEPTSAASAGIIAYMAGIAGMLIVHEVLQDLLEQEERYLKKRVARPFGLAFHENRLYNTKLSQIKKKE